MVRAPGWRPAVTAAPAGTPGAHAVRCALISDKASRLRSARRAGARWSRQKQRSRSTMKWMHWFSRYRRRNQRRKHRLASVSVQAPLLEVQAPLPIPDVPTRQSRKEREPDFKSDGLAVWGKNLAFLRDPRFVSAYA